MPHFPIVDVVVVLLAIGVQFVFSTELSNDDTFDVIVVGAGLTGLSAAREVKERLPAARVKLIEARSEAGGRVRAKTMKTADGDGMVDIGSQFISPSSSALNTLASELGCSLFVQANCGVRTLHLRGIRNKRELNSLSTAQSFREVLESPELQQLSSQNVHEFIVEKKLSPVIMDTANRLLQTLFDAPDVSMSIVHLLLAQASENATIVDLLSRFGHGQGLLMQGGLNRLIRALTKDLDIQLNEIVTAIEEVGPLVKVKTTSHYYEARQVIVTVPPVVTPSIRFTPSLPTEYVKFIESYAPTGHAFYFTLTYANPFWRGQGRNGQLIYTNALGPIVWLTTFDVGPPTTCEGSGATGILWGLAHFSQPMTTSQRYAAYVDVITKSLGDGQLPLDTSDEHFMSDPFSRGSIAALPPKVDIAGLRYIQGVNYHGQGVVFASAEYSNISMGLMNGAVLSGQLAGASVAQRLLNTEGSIRGGNEIANMVRLSDDVEKVTSNFVYRTSTHYPPITPIETSTFKHFSFGNTNDDLDENGAEQYMLAASQDVDPASVQGSFTYDTSSQYPSTEPIETTTMKHFSFGNADPVKEFVSSSYSFDPPSVTIPTTTTTETTTFTIADPLRTTTPFEYSTSPVHTIPPDVETTTFKHFSFENLDTSILSYQQDVQSNNVIDDDLLKQLRDVIDMVPTSSKIQVAIKLSSILKSLLVSMQTKR